MNKNNINFIIIKYLIDNNFLISLNDIEKRIIKETIINENDLMKVNKNLDTFINDMFNIKSVNTLKDILINDLINNIFFNKNDTIKQQLKNIEYVFNQFNIYNFELSFKLNHIILKNDLIYTNLFNFDKKEKYNLINILDYKVELLNIINNFELEDITFIYENIIKD